LINTILEVLIVDKEALIFKEASKRKGRDENGTHEHVEEKGETFKESDRTRFILELKKEASRNTLE
jgi:hypothetical protein